VRPVPTPFVPGVAAGDERALQVQRDEGVVQGAGVPGGARAAKGARVRKPDWLRVQVPPAPQFRATAGLVERLRLHTVCDEARCPNKGECFAAGTATFLILGDECSRACGFCSVRHGRPGGAVDADEPRRVAESARTLCLKHVVVTSVTRDDLPDGGARQFAATIAALRQELPDTSVEVLIPDLGGDEEALATVLAERPDVLNHNLETVPRLYGEVRPGASYRRSLELLLAAARSKGAGGPALVEMLAARGVYVRDRSAQLLPNTTSSDAIPPELQKRSATTATTPIGACMTSTASLPYATVRSPALPIPDFRERPNRRRKQLCSRKISPK